jgi:glycosyltransferase involved in cell wall biosynthesis
MHQNKIVCICSAYYYPHFGGVEKYAENMANYLVAQGYHVIVVTSSIDSKTGVEIYNGVTVYRLPVFGFLKERYPVPVFFSKEYRRLIKLIKQHDITYYILNARFYLTTLVTARLAKESKKKIIVIEHGTGHIKTGNRIVDKLWIFTEHFLTWILKLRYQSLFYGVSKACNRWLLHFGIHSRGVMYNCIDSHEMKPGSINFKDRYKIPDDAVVFTFAGRLIKEKGVLFILDLFKEFVNFYPNAYLFVAGNGPLQKDVQEYACKNIIITGKLDHPEMIRLLAFSDVVLIPSFYPEGLPTLILEAGYSKCAVIATDQGGSAEVITSDQLGFIIPEIDKEKFFNAMKELTINPILRKRLQENLHQRVMSEFTWDAGIKNVMNIIAQQ